MIWIGVVIAFFTGVFCWTPLTHSLQKKQIEWHEKSLQAYTKIVEGALQYYKPDIIFADKYIFSLQIIRFFVATSLNWLSSLWPRVSGRGSSVFLSTSEGVVSSEQKLLFNFLNPEQFMSY